MFKWFKKNENKKMNADQLAPIKEELQSVPKFQWVKTEKTGHVVQFKDVVYSNGMILVEFNDGSRVNYDLLGDVVIKVEDDAMLLDLGTTEVQHTQVNQVNIGKPKQVHQTSSDTPVQALLRKQKPNVVPVEISIQLNLPSVSLYKVLSQSFENADDEIVQFIVADLDIQVIKDAVKEAILNFYHNDNE